MTPLLMIAGAAGVWYLVSCAAWPVKACSRCQGSGKLRSPNGKNWRPCRRCDGSGGRVRIGRRLWTWWRRTARKL